MDETSAGVRGDNPRIEALEPFVALHAGGELGDRPFPEVLGELLGAVWAECEASGAVTVDAPYAWYRRWDDAVKIIEGGQPIDAASRSRVRPPDAQPGPHRVEIVDVPGGPAAVLWHVGHYEGLPAAWDRLWGWVGAQGRNASGPAREEYWTDPDTAPPEEWRTRLVIPLDA